MRKDNRREGWTSADAIGPGQKHDELGRLVPDLDPDSPITINAANQIAFDMTHPTIAKLLARIAALEQKAGYP